MRKVSFLAIANLGQLLSYHIGGFLGGVDADGIRVCWSQVDENYTMVPTGKDAHIPDVQGWATDKAGIVL